MEKNKYISFADLYNGMGLPKKVKKIPWNKGKKFPGIGGRKKGCSSWNKGIIGIYKTSEETKRKISEKLKGRKKSDETRKRSSISARKGKDCNLWNGGTTLINKKIRASLEYVLWRKSVFERDNYTCQKTGIKGGTLHPHHIKNFAEYPELRFSIDNGITLNKESHKEFHNKYGRKGNNYKQLQEYLNLKVYSELKKK